MSDYLRLIARRALTSNDPALPQVGFEAAVLDRYRGSGAFQVMRTDTVGRVKKQGGWSRALGVAPPPRCTSRARCSRACGPRLRLRRRRASPVVA